MQNKEKFIAAIKAGEVFAYPTDTVYGLGCDAFNVKAIKKIFKLKGREKNKPISILVSDLKMLKRVAKEIPPVAKILIKKYWPGKLTIIFKKHKNVPTTLTGKNGKIGVRICNCPLINELIKEANTPITTTSANVSDAPPALSHRDVKKYFGDKISFVIKSKRLNKSLGSTVVDVTGNKIEIIRQGDIKIHSLKNRVIVELSG